MILLGRRDPARMAAVDLVVQCWSIGTISDEQAAGLAAAVQPVTLPAVWTRSWGAGRVFVSTVGHKLDDLTLPPIRTITERDLLWAARQN